MIVKRPQMERALDRPDPAVRLFLLYGPDEAGSRDLAGRLATALPGAERIDLTGTLLKADPARLADEAASLSLFGDRRYIRVDPAGDEVMPAVDALLESAGAANPVVLIAGALRKDARLLKLASTRAEIVACQSYLPEGAEADRVAIAIGAARGVRIAPDVAQRLIAATGGDRGLLAQEVEKFALYLDAAPNRPLELDPDAFEALAADSETTDLAIIVNAAFAGDLAGLDTALVRTDLDAEAIPILRALLRRVMLLSTLSADAGRSGSTDAAMAGAGKAIFFKERAAVARQLSRWSPPALARAAERLAAAEREVKSARFIGASALGEELFAIARAARRR